MGLRDVVLRRDRVGTALEQAKVLRAANASGEQPSGWEGAVTGLIETLVGVGIKGKAPFESATTVAGYATAATTTMDAAIDHLVRSHVRLAATEGFLTSIGGFITLPVALPANVVSFYILSARMTAGIATIRGYDITDPHIKTAVLLTLVGADRSDVLRKAGLLPTSSMVNLASGRIPDPALMMVNKAVAFRIATMAGRKSLSRLGKAVPIAGGFIGAGLDAYLMRSIAGAARAEFPAKPALIGEVESK